MAKRTCSLDDCDRDYEARGYCGKHYMRWWKANRSKVRKKSSKPPEVRFWEKVDKTDECWVWTGASNVYGNFWTGDKYLQAHRYAYELLVGPIPDGLTIDHLCRNKLCVNPAHMEPVTLAENIQREAEAQPVSTHCGNGHEFTPENTYLRRKADGSVKQRCCRTCMRQWNRDYAARKKEATST